MPRNKIRNSSFAIDVGGTNGGIIIPNSPSLNPTDYIAVVIRVYLKQGIPCNLIDNSTNGVTNHIYCYVDGLGKLYWYSTIGGVAKNIVAAKAPYRPNAFNDYVFYYNSSKIEIYANGEFVANLITTGALGVNTQSFRVGQHHTGTTDSQGYISVCRVYHTNAYTFQDHIDFINQDTVRAAIASTCVLDLDASTGSGTTVFDLSGQGNHGAFSRGIWNTRVPYKARNVISGRIPVSGRVAVTGRLRIVNDLVDEAIITRILNIQGWYKGSSLTSLADAAVVDAWPDSSGLSNDLAASGALRPTFYKTTAAQLLNGHPTVFFNGANLLSKASGFSGKPFTVFMVTRSNTEPGAQYFFDGSVSNTAAMYRIGYSQRIFGGGPALITGGSVGSAWRMLTAVFNGANSVAGIDSVEELGNAGNTVNTGVYLGSPGAGDAGSRLNGNIAEVIIAVGAVDESVRRQVRQYLCAKYNL